MNSAFVRHKQKISDLMNDKFEEFHNGNRKAEETLKRLNDQKQKSFFFNKNGKSRIPAPRNHLMAFY